MRNGTTFLGYRLFNHYRLLRKSNIRKFFRNFGENKKLYEEGTLSHEDFVSSLSGWFGYAQWANTYKLRRSIIKEIDLEISI